MVAEEKERHYEFEVESEISEMREYQRIEVEDELRVYIISKEKSGEGILVNYNKSGEGVGIDTDMFLQVNDQITIKGENLQIEAIIKHVNELGIRYRYRYSIGIEISGSDNRHKVLELVEI